MKARERALDKPARVPSIFVTGPVRSGKSRFAERLARERGGEIVFVATARRDPNDAEWTARIARHAAERPPLWALVETASDGMPIDALETLAENASAAQTLIVDSLGTWLADIMLRESDAQAVDARAQALARALLATRAYAIVVGEETGWGIVPEYPSGRVFRDVLGRVQQRLAAESLGAYLVVAGFAVDLKSIGRPVS
jgi:adenosylcobinamide kinase/adenosylcobinamide-phosphate guanylyltransferase